MRSDHPAYRPWSTERLRVAPVISVVVPVRNEEWRVLPAIGAIAAHVSSMGQPWELVVADDGSTDGTVGLVEALHYANLRLLVPMHRGGRGSAVRCGMRAARGDLVLFADIDLAPQVGDVDLLFERLLRRGDDIVVGSAARREGVTGPRGALERLAIGSVRVLGRVGLGIDVGGGTGFTLFRAPAARQIFARQRVDGPAFELEVLLLAHQLRMKVAAVPMPRVGAGR
jgi:dolichyl-phosphate beta-glucosyltransferase